MKTNESSVAPEGEKMPKCCCYEIWCPTCYPPIPPKPKLEPLEGVSRWVEIRKMGNDLFFVDWGNVHFSTSLKGMRDLANDLDRFIWKEFYPSKDKS